MGGNTGMSVSPRSTAACAVLSRNCDILSDNRPFGPFFVPSPANFTDPPVPSGIIPGPASGHPDGTLARSLIQSWPLSPSSRTASLAEPDLASTNCGTANSLTGGRIVTHGYTDRTLVRGCVLGKTRPRGRTSRSQTPNRSHIWLPTPSGCIAHSTAARIHIVRLVPAPSASISDGVAALLRAYAMPSGPTPRSRNAEFPLERRNGVRMPSRYARAGSRCQCACGSGREAILQPTGRRACRSTIACVRKAR